jgi:hypothetical protein
LTYDLILPNNINGEILYHLFRNYIGENMNYSIYFLKIILKFPKIINSIKENLIKELLNNIYEIMGRNKNLNFHKKIFMQIIGLFALFMGKEKEKKPNVEPDKNQIFIETAVFTIAHRFYRYMIQYMHNDLEIFDILKKILFYFREIFDKSSKINLIFEFKFLEFPKLVHSHVQLMRISFFSLPYDSLLMNRKNLEHYFATNKFMIDNNINFYIYIPNLIKFNYYLYYHIFIS